MNSAVDCSLSLPAADAARLVFVDQYRARGTRFNIPARFQVAASLPGGGGFPSTIRASANLTNKGVPWRGSSTPTKSLISSASNLRKAGRLTSFARKMGCLIAAPLNVGPMETASLQRAFARPASLAICIVLKLQLKLRRMRAIRWRDAWPLTLSVGTWANSASHSATSRSFKER